MPIEVRPIDPRNRKRKKMGSMGPSKPTRMGKLEEIPTMTQGMIQRRKEMEKRNRRALPPAAGMLTGGQAKLDKNKNGRIDAQDFKILKAEKAKGRGKGLQDEKMKPGKVTKAALGILAAGMGAKKAKDKKKMVPGAIGGIGLSMAKSEAIRKILGKKMGGKIIKAKKSKFIERRKNLAGLGTVLRRDPTKAIDKVGVKDRYGMDIKPKTSQLGRDLASQAAKAAKATRMGKIAAGVAAAALAAKAGLEKMYEKRTGKKPFTKRPDRKMGGGMMMRPNPVGYKTGKMIKARGCKLGRNKPTKMY